MKTMEMRARCPACQTERSLWGPFPAATAADLDMIEVRLTGKPTMARCPQCDHVELVAMFVDGARVEAWQDADEMERQNGPSAGPLPPKPWPDTN